MALREMKIVCMEDGRRVWTEIISVFVGADRQLAECIQDLDPFVAVEDGKKIDPSLLSENVDKSFVLTFGR